jgi:long-chain acyl-CoA synthetase
MTIPANLERAARLFGDRPAYVEGERRVTWSETWRLAQETAAGLVALGLQKGDRVAICAENSVDWIVAYHAVALAGGCGVLVYFELKPGEIVEQVSRPGSRFLVASAGVLAKLPDGVPGIETVILAGDRDAAGAIRLAHVAAKATDASRAELASRAPAPDELAAIIYTSGTTGGAKGVMLAHRNFMANGLAVRQHIRFGGDESVLLVLPLHHAMTFLATVILPALVGANFVIENDLLRLRDRLRQHKPTIFFGVPALFELLYRNILARAEAEGRLATLQKGLRISRLVKRLTGLNIGPLVFKQVHQALGGRLRFLVSGGAALNPQTALDYFALGLPLLQGWGMTEAWAAIAVPRF